MHRKHPPLPPKVLHFRNVLGHMGRIYRGRGHPCRGVISTKVHSSSFVGIMLLREVLLCRFAKCFWGILLWDGPWGTAFASSYITNTLYCKCKSLQKRAWWLDNRLLQVLANTYITRITNYVKFLQKKEGKKYIYMLEKGPFVEWIAATGGELTQCLLKHRRLKVLISKNGSTLKNTRSLQMVSWNSDGTTQMYGCRCFFEITIHLK